MSRPNIVLFTWHDAGDWFGCYGYDRVQTPHVDRLAAEGVRFSRHYSACAICSPSRAAIATGRFCQANGVMSLANTPFMDRIHPHIPHLARRCKDLGYRTTLMGVQHEAAHVHVSAVLGVDEQIATDPWPDADRLAAQVDPWLARQGDQEPPFYLQIGTYDAHLNRFFSGRAPDPAEAYSPVQDTSRGLHIPDYLLGSDEDRATVATLQGQLQRGDRLMGALLDGLDRHGLGENTIVLMCVDHGVGLTRAKTTCYEAGTRVGWIIRAPDRLPAGHVVDELCTHVDVLPTLWELLGEAPIAGLDGHSLAAHARGAAAGPVHEFVPSHMVETTRCIRSDRDLLIRNFAPPRFVDRRGDCGEQWRLVDRSIAPVATPHLEYYDLRLDPDNLHNRSEDPDRAERVAELDAALWDFLIAQDDFLIHESIRTPWQRRTRDELEAHCARRGLGLPMADGPLHNAVDGMHAGVEV